MIQKKKAGRIQPSFLKPGIGAGLTIYMDVPGRKLINERPEKGPDK
jgi:hypothetical protein